MSLQGVWSECLEFHPQKRLVVENSGGRLSSDAGLLLVRELDERLGLTEQFAAVIEEWRREPTHSLLSMVRQRIYGCLHGNCR
ncbi:MAG: transposase [Planctomycetaceae bacterium]